MKIGIRTPSLKKSIKARTTGKLKRTIKKEINPLYGTTTMGLIRNPKKAIYNRVYNRTTIGTGISGAVVGGAVNAMKPKQENMIITSAVCSNCGYENGINNQYCANCGIQFTKVENTDNIRFCSNCGYHINPTDRFCLKCGKQVRG